MNDLRKPLSRGGFARPPEAVDALLRRFFHAEMPEPWPAAPAVPAAAAAPREPQRRGGFRLSSRFALAAAVALFVIGYLTLAGRFAANGDPANRVIRPVIGKNDGVRPNLPPKMHNRVGGKVELLQPQVVPLRGGGEAEIRGIREQGPRRTIHLHVERIR